MIGFLAVRWVQGPGQAPFEGRGTLDKGALRWGAPTLTKGIPPFRKEMPEAFSSDALEFLHDRAAAHVGGCSLLRPGCGRAMRTSP